MRRALVCLASLLIASVCRPAAADASACPPLPEDVTWPLSEAALELQCRFGGRPCAEDPAHPEAGVAACGGLVCRAPEGAASGSAVCSLPTTRAECSVEERITRYGDPTRTGGVCAIKVPCTRVAVMGAATDLPGGPDALPTRPIPNKYQPSPETVFEVCGGLGCVDDPDVDDAEVGFCALANTADECGGLAEPGLYQGRCGPRHPPVSVPKPIHPRRYLATGGYVIDLGNDVRGSDVVPGGIFQIALTSSKVKELEDGSHLHFGLPSWYAHTALLVSRRRFAPELGLVYKTGAELLTRCGVAAYAQLWSPDDLLSSSRFGAGPSVHIELFYNLLVRGAYLIGDDDAPELTFGVQYAASLFEDFK